MAALTTRAAAMTLAAGVTFAGGAAFAPGAFAAPTDASNGSCTPVTSGPTSELVICPSPKVRAGKTTVEVGKDLTFEITNLLAFSKYTISADAFKLTGRDSKGLADKFGDDKRGLGNKSEQGQGITVPLNVNLKNSKTIDPNSGSVTLTFKSITNDAGKPSRNLTLTFKITKATDAKTIKELRAGSEAARGNAAKLSFLLNIAKGSRSASDNALIKKYEGSKGSATTGTVLTSATSPAQPSGSLAFTGAEIAGMSIVGLGLIGTGAFLVVGARRRKGAPVA